MSSTPSMPRAIASAIQTTCTAPRHRTGMTRTHGFHESRRAAPHRVVLRRILDVLVDRAERALLGAALALRAALEGEVGDGDVARARVHGLAARGGADALDGG